MVRTGATFADAAAEYLRWIEHDRTRTPSTVRDDQSIINAHLLPAFGTKRLEDITPAGARTGEEIPPAWPRQVRSVGDIDTLGGSPG